MSKANLHMAVTYGINLPSPPAKSTLLQCYYTTIAQYTPAHRPPHVYAIHHTILVMAISCKGQRFSRKLSMYTLIYIYMHICIHTHTYIYTYTYTCIYMYAQRLPRYSCLNVSFFSFALAGRGSSKA